MKTCFKDAQIVGHSISPSKYNTETQPRGSKTFTVRSHVLCEIMRNAERWLLGYESPESKAKEWGDLLDCIALTPMAWPKRFAVLPPDPPRRPSDRQRNAKKPRPETIAAIEWWDKWESEHQGVEIITADMNGMAHAAAKRLTENEKIADMLKSGPHQIQINATYEDATTGLSVPIKGLIDIVPDPEHPLYGDALADLKTARNVSPRLFAKAIFEYHYAEQAALYLDLYNAATGENRVNFFHIAQENYGPYTCRMPQLSGDWINFGRIFYRTALEKYCRCLATGHWPSYDGMDENPVSTPEPWMVDPTRIYEPINEPAEESEPPTDTEEKEIIP